MVENGESEARNDQPLHKSLTCLVSSVIMYVSVLVQFGAGGKYYASKSNPVCVEPMKGPGLIDSRGLNKSPCIQ